MSVARDSVAGMAGRRRTVRVVVRAWRELTGGTGRDRDHERRTLIAASGGGDSSGLLLALAAGVTRASEWFVVGHVVHDLRPRMAAEADRDAVRALASRLGLGYMEAEVRVKAEAGNAEAVARRLRYGELSRMAKEAGCGFVATAHHAEDQLETMLMALVRGAGVRGLAGIAPSRREGGVRVIRPALGVSRHELRNVCEEAGWEWREDSTNLDETRLRAAIRARVLPELETLRPGAAKRAGRAAHVVRGAARVVRGHAERVVRSASVGNGLSWERARLRRCSTVVLGEVIRVAARRLVNGTGADRMSASAVGKVVRAIRDRGTQPREFAVGAVVVEVTVREVMMRKVEGAGKGIGR